MVLQKMFCSTTHHILYHTLYISQILGFENSAVYMYSVISGV
jgi:hypothetical protein